jgi:hypothetical protein
VRKKFKERELYRQGIYRVFEQESKKMEILQDKRNNNTSKMSTGIYLFVNSTCNRFTKN